MTPAVTVIMPVCNGERFLAEALDSLFAQTFSDFIIIVIDDGSVDRTREILARCDDPRILVIRNPAPVGPAAARNMGLDLARSRHVAFFDSDDVADLRRLEVQMAFLSHHPDVGLLAGRVSVVDDQGQPAGDLWGHDGPAATIASTMLFRNCLATSTIVADRAAIGDQRFDSTLPLASDYDMWLRLVDRTPVACLPNVVASYRVHRANLTHTKQASAEACLERILRRRLARLGIDPTPSEVQLHRRLATDRLEGTDGFMNAVAVWLAQLDRANETTRIYGRDPFRRVLAAYWLGVCETAARERGWRSWPQMTQSPLFRRAAFDPAAWPRMAHLPWRTVRTSLRHLRRRRVAHPSVID
jgi:glycosyltransferase involved in cell wall biosynthesis